MVRKSFPRSICSLRLSIICRWFLMNLFVSGEHFQEQYWAFFLFSSLQLQVVTFNFVCALTSMLIGNIIKSSLAYSVAMPNSSQFAVTKKNTHCCRRTISFGRGKKNFPIFSSLLLRNIFKAAMCTNWKVHSWVSLSGNCNSTHRWEKLHTSQSPPPPTNLTVSQPASGPM